MRKASRKEVLKRVDDSRVTIEAMGNSERFHVYSIGQGPQKVNSWEGTFPNFGQAVKWAEITAQQLLEFGIEFERVEVVPD